MRRRHLFFGFLLFGIALLVFSLYSVPIKDIFSIYKNAKLYTVLAYFVVSSLIMLILAYKWKIIMQAIGYRVKFGRLLQYRFAGYAVNFIFPFGGLLGEPVRAALLTREEVPFKKAFSSILVDKSVEYIINILCFVIGVSIVFFVYRYKAKTSFFLILFSLIGLLGVILAVITYFRGRPFLSPWVRRLGLHNISWFEKIEDIIWDIEQGVLEFYKHSPKPFLKLIALNLFLWVLMFSEYKLALLILGFNAPLVGVFLVLVFVGLSQLLPIPAELGVLEVGQLSAAKLLSLQPSLAIALSFLVRFRDILWAIVGFSILFHLGISGVGSLFSKNDKEK